MITFLFLCLSSSFLSFLWLPQILKKISMYIQEQNEKIYAPRGLLLTDPIERGMRVVSFTNGPGWFSVLRYAFLKCWHNHKLWTLMTYPVCLLKRLCSFSCLFKLRYFPMTMFSFQFWLPQKTERWFIFGLAQHDASQHCCDCVSAILSKVGSHTFLRVTYYTKNIASPSAVQLRWHFDMLI